MKIKERLEQIDTVVYVLVMVFAISSWIDVNGLWVELPLLVEELPEGWALPSYITVIIQVANVGPLLYTVCRTCWPQRVKEWPVIYVIIGLGIVACLLLAVFWNHTTTVMGTPHSTALLSLAAVLSLVDCTSSVVFLPYMAFFPPQYLSALYIGEGLSGFVPGIVGLVQGVGSDPTCLNETVYNETTHENTTRVVAVYPDPRFSVEAFFLFLCAVLTFSAAAFSALHWSPRGRRRRSSHCQYEVSGDKASQEMALDAADPVPRDVDLNTFCGTSRDGIIVSAPKSLWSGHVVFLLACVTLINAFINGILPGTSSYSALPYSSMVYTLAVRLSSIANPVACVTALVIPLTSRRGVALLTGAGSLLVAYQLWLAAASPHPPLQGQLLGDVLAVASPVLLTAVFSYTKLGIASFLREEGALLWCGVFTQVGSLTGAIISFTLVNVAKVFEAGSSQPCS